MLLGKPASEVFRAFVDPAVTSKFWFSKSSGVLEAGKRVDWTWEMFGVSVQVDVKEHEGDKRLLVEWSHHGTTFVTVTQSGLQESGDDVMNSALDSTQGFNLGLAGAKALLEHNVILNLVSDRYPETAMPNHGGSGVR